MRGTRMTSWPRFPVRPHGGLSWTFFTVGAVVALLTGAAGLLWPTGSYTPLSSKCEHSELFVVGGTDISLNYERRRLISQWNEKHRHATLVEVSDSTDLQHSQIKAMEESGGCAYDVLIMDNTWTAQFAESGYLRPLDDFKELKDFFPNALRTGMWHGDLYAVPFNVDVGLLYRRTDMQTNTKKPDSWARLIDSPVIMQLADYEGLTVNALESVWNSGGAGFMGEGGRDEKYLRENVHQALEEFATRVRAPDPEARKYHERESIDAFASSTQKARASTERLMRNWPYAFSTLAAEPQMQKDGGLRFEVSALPGRTVLGGQNLAVAKRSPHAADAEKLVEFLTEKRNQKELFACGGLAPARYSALGLRPGQTVPKDWPLAKCSELDKSMTGLDETNVLDHEQLRELGRAIVTALPGASPRPVTAHYSTFSRTFRGCVAKMINNEAVGKRTFARAVRRSLDGQTASC
ncbi:extracellular solute-binding protein [Actinomadura luteofluorescens]|uniref:extracellular solute-binding protein n=1 Tax=Actinomadura luteofluorescens TaxID=46163 RepID=UPI00349B16D6